MLHAHTIAARGFDRSVRMPSGNGMPMKNAIGAIIEPAMKMRNPSPLRMKWADTPG